MFTLLSLVPKLVHSSTCTALFPELQPNAEEPVENSDTLEDATARSWKGPRVLSNAMHQRILISNNPLVHIGLWWDRE